MLEVSRGIIGPIIVLVCEKLLRLESNLRKVGKQPWGLQRSKIFRDWRSAKHMTISGTKWRANGQQGEGGSHQADKL